MLPGRCPSVWRRRQHTDGRQEAQGGANTSLGRQEAQYSVGWLTEAKLHGAAE